MASKDEMLRRSIQQSSLPSAVAGVAAFGDYHLGRLGHRQQDKPATRQQVQTARVAADASLYREVQAQVPGRRMTGADRSDHTR